MTSIRKTKKLLKMRKQAVVVTSKEWDFAEPLKMVYGIDSSFTFTRFGVTVWYEGIPCEHIPYWHIGNINTIKL